MHITLDEFEASLEEASFPLAVAVSGGMDSLTLLLLAHELAQKRGSYVIGLTVDHGLRPESKDEASRVGQWAQERGIQHITLEWVGDKPQSRLQERARNARYSLLIEWCKKHQIASLLLGHHQQDQEETFWLRLSAGSGLDGLSGMKERVVRKGIIFLRPLLSFSKDRLKETLLANHQEWIEDPSNHKAHFFRGRVRRFFQEEGLSSFRLLQIMGKLRTDADFIQGALEKAIEASVQIHEGGYLTLNKHAFNGLHPAITGRLVSFLVRWFSNKDYSPRSSQVKIILDKIKKGAHFTIGGIYWMVSQEEIFLFREQRAIKDKFYVSQLQEKVLWDRRFWVEPGLSHYVPKEVIIGPLGLDPELKKEINTPIPRRAWPTLPALWEKGKVVVVPHLCYDTLRCEKDLRKIIYLKPLFHDSLRFTI